MLLLNNWPSDDEQLAGQWLTSFYSGEDSDWWVSIQRCAATVALAAGLSLATSTLSQAVQAYSWLDEPVAAANLPQAYPVEDYVFYGFVSW